MNVLFWDICGHPPSSLVSSHKEPDRKLFFFLPVYACWPVSPTPTLLGSTEGWVSCVQPLCIGTCCQTSTWKARQDIFYVQPAISYLTEQMWVLNESLVTGLTSTVETVPSYSHLVVVDCWNSCLRLAVDFLATALLGAAPSESFEAVAGGVSDLSVVSGSAP